jgi:hypothetical protein
VPKENDSIFYELAEVFTEGGLYSAITVPKIGAGIGWFQHYRSNESDIPDRCHLKSPADRQNWDKFYRSNLIYVHAVKMNSIANEDYCKKYCNNYLLTYLNAISVDKSARTAIVNSNVYDKEFDEHCRNSRTNG